MAKINSRNKGVRGELELAKWLTDRGFTAWRGRQRKGADDAPDVACPMLDDIGLQIECKRVESFQPYKALQQANEDAGPLKAGIVFHRRNAHDWICVIDSGDMMALLGELIELRKTANNES